MADVPTAGESSKTSGQTVEATRRELIRIQIETGMTYAKMARRDFRPATSDRHRAQARRAYDAAMKWAQEIRMPLDDEIWEALREFRDLLRAIGEPA